MRCLFQISLSLLLLAAIAGAQTPEQLRGPKPERSWDNLRALGVGEKIQVIDQKSKSWRGRFRSVSDETITLQTGRDEIMIQRADVLRIKSLERNRRGRNAVIGLAIGAGIAGAIVLAAIASSALPLEAVTAIPAWGGIGAGLGAIFPGHRTIYRAERRKDQTAP